MARSKNTSTSTSDQDGKRLAFAGLASGSFDVDLKPGETAELRVLVRCKSDNNKLMASEGVRHQLGLSVEKATFTLTEKLVPDDSDPDQMSIDDAADNVTHGEFGDPQFSDGQ